MKKFIGIIIFSFILITNASAFDKDLAWKTGVRIMVKKPNTTGFCNGVVISNTENYATILTAKHCVVEQEKFYVEDNEAYLVQKSNFYDLAFLYVPNHLKDKIEVKIAPNKAGINSEVYYVGEVFGLYIYSYGRVIVHNITGTRTESTLEIIHGCSGGGVLNKNNELVGIISTGLFLKGMNNRSTMTCMVNLTSINYFLLMEVGDWNGSY